MTQKEKLVKAFLFANRVGFVANALEQDAREYDVRFPLARARELRELSEELKKILG